jgi:hypothetical protein
MNRTSERDHGRISLAARVQRPIASGLSVVGGVLIVLGLGRVLYVLGVLPPRVATWLAGWWPIAIVAAGVGLLVTGRRVTGTVLTLIGGIWLITTAVPAGFVAPVLLIATGALFLAAAVGGRRWVLGGPGIAVFTDAVRSDADPARSYVAVFGGSSGHLDPDVVSGEVVECLAVFGDVQLTVPADVSVELAETAIFGDVRAPVPPTAPVRARVRVRATSVFGDVRLRRV